MELSKGSLFTALWYLCEYVRADATCMWREVFNIGFEISTGLWGLLEVYKDRKRETRKIKKKSKVSNS